MRIETIPYSPLFRSHNQLELLAMLFLSDKGFTVQELSKRLDTPYSTIHRETSRLLEFEIIHEERVGNYRFFEPDRSSPMFRPLRDLLEVISGPIPLLKKELLPILGIEWVALFGSWAHGLLNKTDNHSKDVDVLVIGTPEIRLINLACTVVGKKLGREVNPVILTSSEWMLETPFLRQVRSGGLVTVFDTKEWNRKNESVTSLPKSKRKIKGAD